MVWFLLIILSLFEWRRHWEFFNMSSRLIVACASYYLYMPVIVLLVLSIHYCRSFEGNHFSYSSDRFYCFCSDNWGGMLQWRVLSTMQIWSGHSNHQSLVWPHPPWTVCSQGFGTLWMLHWCDIFYGFQMLWSEVMPCPFERSCILHCDPWMCWSTSYLCGSIIRLHQRYSILWVDFMNLSTRSLCNHNAFMVQWDATEGWF